MRKVELRGVVIPLMTPLTADHDVDEQVLREIVDFELDAGVHGLFVLGSFGQGPALELEQRMAAAEVVLEQARGRVPVVIHVGCVDTPSAIKLAKHAERHGADVIAVIPPFYYDHVKYEWMAHFAEIANAVDLPLFLYNNKAYCNIDVTPDLAKELVERVPQLIGQKLAYSTLDNLLQHVRTLPPGFATFAGTSTLLLPAVPFGAAGIISPQSSLFPELAVELWHAVEARDWERAFALQARVIDVALTVTKLYKTYGRGVDREVMRMRGFDVKSFPRWPTKPMEPADLERLRDVLAKAEVLTERR